MFQYRLLFLWSICLIIKSTLAQPGTESFSHRVSTQLLDVSYATATTTGGKQEDRFSPQQRQSPEFCLCENNFMSICDCDSKLVSFGIYDGHGRSGAFAAEHARDHLLNNLKTILQKNEPMSDALKSAFLDTNDLFTQRATKKNIHSSGTTATIAVFENTRIHIANVGDTEAITYFGNTDFFDTNRLETVTRKHHAGTYGEYQRLADFGSEHEMFDATYTKKAWIEEIAISKIKIKQFAPEMQPIVQYGKKTISPLAKEAMLKRICVTTPDNRTHRLVPSRAIGDVYFHPFVTATPSVQAIDISEPGFILIASDGLWDLISRKAAAQFICHQSTLVGKSNAQIIVQNLIDLVLDHANQWNIELDDITATLIFIQPRNTKN